MEHSGDWLFRASDIPALAQAVPHAVGLNKLLAPEDRHHSIAHALHDSFACAVFCGTQLPTDQQASAEYERIAKAASELLRALGYHLEHRNLSALDDATFWRTPRGAHDRLQSDYAGFIGGGIDHVRSRLPRAAEHVEAVRQATSDIVASLQGRPAVARRSNQAGTRELFRGLAGTFFACFSLAPDVSSARIAKTAPAPLWARAVLDLALQRAETTGAVSGLKGVADQVKSLRSHVTLANRLRDGWLEWVASPHVERWPGHVWWPHVWNNHLVPDWAAAAPDPEPRSCGKLA